MAKITRIKASDGPKKEVEPKPKEVKKPVEIEKTSPKAAEKTTKKIEKSAEKKTKKEGKKVFILFRPFVALGRYLKESWAEIRQVRWPNRKATWKMVLAVLIYTALFVIIISLLDLLFKWLIGLFIT